MTDTDDAQTELGGIASGRDRGRWGPCKTCSGGTAEGPAGWCLACLHKRRVQEGEMNLERLERWRATRPPPQLPAEPVSRRRSSRGGEP